MRRHCIILVMLLNCIAGHAQSGGLTQMQIDSAVHTHQPDADLAKEILSQGIAFSLTQQLLDEWRASGAGPATVAALTYLLPTGSLNIMTLPGANIQIDDNDLGISDNDGALLIGHITAGPHSVSVSKPNYATKTVTAVVVAAQTLAMNIDLAWAVGFLTIRVTPHGASIHIPKVGDFSGNVVDYLCPPGSYEATIAEAGFAPQTLKMEIVAGRHADAEAKLDVDPAFARAALDDGTSMLGAGNYEGALADARKVLALDPGNKQALSLVANTYLLEGDIPHFEASADAALTGGGIVGVTLLHFHSYPHKSLYRALLVITPEMISFNPPPKGGDRTKEFHGRIQDVQEDEVSGSTPRDLLLRLKIKDAVDEAGRKVGDQTLDFAVPGASIVIPPGTIYTMGPDPNVYIQSPNNSDALLLALKRIVDRAKTGGVLAQAAGPVSSATVGHYLAGLRSISQGDAKGMASNWDNIIAAGEALQVPACHERGMLNCEKGLLIIRPDGISFEQNTQHRLFDLQWKTLTSSVIDHPPHIALRLESSKNAYNIDFLPSVPPEVKCSELVFVECPAPYDSMALPVLNYIAGVIAELQSHALNSH